MKKSEVFSFCSYSDFFGGQIRLSDSSNSVEVVCKLDQTSWKKASSGLAWSPSDTSSAPRR